MFWGGCFVTLILEDISIILKALVELYDLLKTLGSRVGPLHKWLVKDVGVRSLDKDPNFGRYRHFCRTIIYVSTAKKNWVHSTRSDNDAVLWIGFI